MSYQFVALFGHTFSTLGTLFVAYAALRVHHRFLHEHKIDEVVFRSMRREKKWGVMGASLIIFGYILISFSLFLE